MTPPRYTTDAPGMAVMAAPSMPPVSDSAVARVWPRSPSVLTIRAARSPRESTEPSWPPAAPAARRCARASRVASRRLADLAAGDRPAAQPCGPYRVVGTGDHGDEYRGGHDHGSQPRRDPGQHVKRDRQHLEEGLELPAPARGDHAVPDDPESQRGHGDLSGEYHDRHPPREPAEVGHRHQGRAGEGLVRDRVGDLAEIGDQSPAPGDAAVQQVGYRGGAERDERRHPP